jgi:gamma-glutamylcyclotransferase (GGCT)/AIG2-like uncharacterized protein YtfP
MKASEPFRSDRITSGPARPSAVFVYGTLLPGQERWPLLEPYALEAREALVRGQIYDTGRGYPGALFDRPGSIPGALIELDPERLTDALTMLDEVEGVDLGLYRRVLVHTDADEPAWSYAWADDPDALVPIERW